MRSLDWVRLFMTWPPLSSVHQDTATAARVLVDTLASLIDNEPVSMTRIPTRLVIRESCGGKGSDHEKAPPGR